MKCPVITSLIVFILQATFLQAQTSSSPQILPTGYEREAMKALSYFPELKNVNILFRIKHAHSPLSTRPTFWSIFKKASKRKYIITISDQSVATLSPILLHQLTDSAKIGVLGHELSHVADFQKIKFTRFIRMGLKHYSEKYQDRFEYNTDKTCIEHGMGYYLLAWSIFVRNALHIKNWRGADNINEKATDCERYMNPPTIRMFLHPGLSK